MRKPVRGMSMIAIALLGGALVCVAPQKSAALTNDDLIEFVKKVVGSLRNVIGRDLNGTGLNGQALDGRQVAAVLMGSAELDGSTLSQIDLEASEFSGVQQDGKRIKRQKFIGVRFEAVLDDGDPLQLVIDDIQASRDKGLHDVLRYAVSYAAADGWQPLCGTDETGAPIMAIPLRGRWNLAQGVPGGGAWIDEPGVFTFACEGFAAAKCVEAGYKPWGRIKACAQGQGCHFEDMRLYHQACTRMLRADYCGDGTPHTHDGVWINMVDDLGLHIDELDWIPEAEWTADGANCIATTRLPDLVPSCMDVLQSDGCGDPAHFQADSLILSEVEQRTEQ